MLCMLGALKAQSLKVGETVSAFELEDLTSSQTIAPTDLEGKILLIDFWATWCAPCITGMPHLQELQNDFREDLKVMAISYENPDRLQRFIQNKPFNFTFAIDNKGDLRDYFPHRIIPHTVLIDKNGEILAITRPNEINKSTIEKIIAVLPIDLPLKSENVKFNPSEDYFKAESGLKEKFEIQPYHPDLPTFAKLDTQGEYSGRRVTLHNFTISGLYRHAHNKSSKRMVLDIDTEKVAYKPENLYNVDIIVPKGKEQDLHQILAEKLMASFSVKASTERREREIAVLYRIDSVDFPLRPANTKSDYEARGDFFSGTGVEINTFADYLESFGIVDKPVVDETGIKGFYAIEFSFDPENPDSFFKSLQELGLGIKKSVRQIEVLVLYEDDEVTGSY